MIQFVPELNGMGHKRWCHSSNIFLHFTNRNCLIRLCWRLKVSLEPYIEKSALTGVRSAVRMQTMAEAEGFRFLFDVGGEEAASEEELGGCTVPRCGGRMPEISPLTCRTPGCSPSCILHPTHNTWSVRNTVFSQFCKTGKVEWT